MSGPGTLAEISLLWNRLLIHAIPPRPLILIGPGWKSTFRQLYITLGEYYTLENRNLITFAPTPEAAVVLVPPPARQPAA
jgi:predicted Rossmann-fold nucleotide-binding protein